MTQGNGHPILVTNGLLLICFCTGFTALTTYGCRESQGRRVNEADVEHRDEAQRLELLFRECVEKSSGMERVFVNSEGQTVVQITISGSTSPSYDDIFNLCGPYEEIIAMGSKAVPFLEKQLVHDGIGPHYAALILGEIGDTQAVPALLQYLCVSRQQGCWLSSIFAARSLGMIGDLRAVGPLRGIFQEIRPENPLDEWRLVKIHIAWALLKLGNVEVIEFLLEEVEGGSAYGYEAAEVLTDATGGRLFSRCGKRWRKWWESNKHDFKPFPED